MDMEMIKNPSKFFSTEKKGYTLSDNPIFEIVRNTLVTYNMPTKLFDKNLSTLIMSDNKPTVSTTFGEVLGSYNAKTNKIIKPNDNKDLIHEVFHMASNKQDGTESMGVLSNGFSSSLNEGITDMFSSFTTLYEDNPEYKYEVRYPVEKLMAEFLGSMYGIKIFKHHFNGDSEGFYKSFDGDKDRIIAIVSELDKFKQFKDNLINVNEVDYNVFANSFINSFTNFINLAMSKNPVNGNMYFELIRNMMRKDIESVDTVKALFGLSDFKSYEAVIDVIEENCFGKSTTL